MDEARAYDSPMVSQGMAEGRTVSAQPEMPPLRRAEVHVAETLERVERLTNMLRERLDPVLRVPQQPGLTAAELASTDGSLIAQTFERWGNRLDVVGDLLSNTLDRLDL